MIETHVSNVCLPALHLPWPLNTPEVGRVLPLKTANPLLLLLLSVISTSLNLTPSCGPSQARPQQCKE